MMGIVYIEQIIISVASNMTHPHGINVLIYMDLQKQILILKFWVENPNFTHWGSRVQQVWSELKFKFKFKFSPACIAWVDLCFVVQQENSDQSPLLTSSPWSSQSCTLRTSTLLIILVVNPSPLRTMSSAWRYALICASQLIQPHIDLPVGNNQTHCCPYSSDVNPNYWPQTPTPITSTESWLPLRPPLRWSPRCSQWSTHLPHLLSFSSIGTILTQCLCQNISIWLRICAKLIIFGLRFMPNIPNLYKEVWYL